MPFHDCSWLFVLLAMMGPMLVGCTLCFLLGWLSRQSQLAGDWIPLEGKALASNKLTPTTNLHKQLENAGQPCLLHPEFSLCSVSFCCSQALFA